MFKNSLRKGFIVEGVSIRIIIGIIGKTRKREEHLYRLIRYTLALPNGIEYKRRFKFIMFLFFIFKQNINIMRDVINNIVAMSIGYIQE